MKNYLLIFSFLLSSHLFAARKIDRTLVVVNEEVILESDIDAFTKKMKSKSYQELFGGVDSKLLSDRNAILQLLIEEKLINQQVKKLELQASPQEVDAQIRVILKRNQISQAQLTERLKDLGTTLADYKEGIQRQLERKNLIDREIKPTLEVSEDQLKHFYLRAARPGDKEVEYKIAQIFINAGPEALTRANKIHGEVSKSPDKFEALVKEYSDDSSTHETGGVLGYFSRSSLSKEFRDVVPKTEVGQTTKPIKTGAGYHVLKVLDKRSSGFDSLPKEQKEAIRNQMMAEELDKKMALWLDRKKAEAHIQVSEAKK